MSRALFRDVSDYVGVPYLDHGRTPAGWDCYGLVYWLNSERLGRAVPSYSGRYSDAERVTEVSSLLRDEMRAWRAVARDALEPGDTLVFTLGGEPLHCGLALDGAVMLHCLRGRNTVREPFDGMAWARRLVGVYRWM
jgi:cell wall-associated NlpC family hydrolase